MVIFPWSASSTKLPAIELRLPVVPIATPGTPEKSLAPIPVLLLVKSAWRDAEADRGEFGLRGVLHRPIEGDPRLGRAGGVLGDRPMMRMSKTPPCRTTKAKGGIVAVT